MNVIKTIQHSRVATSILKVWHNHTTAFQ